MTEHSAKRKPVGPDQEPPLGDGQEPGGETSSSPGEAPISLPTNVQPLLLRPPQAAVVLTISERKLWELAAGNEIPHVRIGRAVRYHYDDLEEWVEQKRRDRRKRGS